MSFRVRGDADRRIKSRLEKRGAFGAVLNKKVDMSKIDLKVIENWVKERITQLLGFEDEVVIGLVTNVLQQTTDAYTGHPIKVDAKELQVQLTGFLAKDAGPFVSELWALLIDAQDAPYGIPRVFVERKKRELLPVTTEIVQEKRSPNPEEDSCKKKRQCRWDTQDASPAPQKQDDKIVVRHILIKHAESRRPSSWREKCITLSRVDAYSELETIRKKLLVASNLEEALSSYATQRSDCPSAVKGGLIAAFRRGDLDRTFEQAAFSLRPGVLSHIIDSPSGLHL
eukprot:CAMPEP_0197314258 /NCGR_PEP_ID=MMETSP0891-20130614/33001_1 /TAXON_ID=44058 ORGANISM="Aureoumbra lagunensis, Strain CCMP1510" /NCGR_SAMPLE_ID=MMETSP0891 /ASSEMBLY_ACC=CAM_ASM_000534 /LENGTH=283 /DNA_ID=CAMNT_0042802619 /DNA_START=24 /DNA_END=872 /DNA_ORIENTATION=+